MKRNRKCDSEQAADVADTGPAMGLDTGASCNSANYTDNRANT